MASPKCCPLAGLFLPLGTALQSLGLALMVGGMLALGAITAPAVFGGLPRDMAAPLMAKIFGRYDQVILGALMATQAGEYFRWISHQLPVKTKLNLFRLVLLVLLSVGVIYSTQTLNPQIEQMNRAGVHRNLSTLKGREFNALHKRSESLYKMELLTAVLLLLLTPFVRPKPLAASAAACSDSTLHSVQTTEEPEKDCCL